MFDRVFELYQMNCDKCKSLASSGVARRIPPRRAPAGPAQPSYGRERQVEHPCRDCLSERRRAGHRRAWTPPSRTPPSRDTAEPDTAGRDAASRDRRIGRWREPPLLPGPEDERRGPKIQGNRTLGRTTAELRKYNPPGSVRPAFSCRDSRRDQSGPPSPAATPAGISPARPRRRCCRRVRQPPGRRWAPACRARPCWTWSPTAGPACRR